LTLRYGRDSKIKGVAFISAELLSTRVYKNAHAYNVIYGIGYGFL